MIFLSNFIKRFCFKLAFLAAFIFLSACDTTAAINARNLEMQQIERDDHQFCGSLGLDIDEENDLKTELYWRCRVVLVKNKIKLTASLEGLRRNAAIRRLITAISRKYDGSYEKWNDSRNSLFNNKDHDACIYQGHNFDSLEQTAVEDYFICRKRLISEQQIIPPFHKTEYFKRPQDTYNIGFAINKKTDKDIERFEAIKAKYPKCIKLFFKKEEFKICKSDYDQQRQCLSTVNPLRAKRELQEKIACQKKSYVRFPDSMLKEDRSKIEEIEKARVAADMSNSSNFFSIGIDEDQLAKFKAEEMLAKKEEDKKTDSVKPADSKASDGKASDAKTTDAKKSKSDDAKPEEKKSTKNFNTKNDLYSKIDLTRLRQQFIFSCQESVDPDLIAYGEKLQKECNAIVEKWENE